MIKLYLILGLLVVAGAGVAGIYAKGQMDARNAMVVNQLKAQLAQMEKDRQTEENARRLDAIQAKLNKEDQEALEQKVGELENALQNADRVCLDGPDADGLRDLIGNKHKKANP